MTAKKLVAAAEIDWRVLLAARATDPSLVAEDEALFLSLPVAKRDAVVERLRVLDEYLRQPQPSLAVVDEASARLGVSRRTFYHLLGKLKEHGPVKGLALGFRIKQRPSVARDGLNPVAEEVLSSAFRRNPEVRAGVAYRAVLQASEQAGLPAPKEAEVRFRLHELRRASRLAPAEIKGVGSSLLVDQCYVDLATRAGDGRLRQIMVTLIVDRSTKLILGHGIGIDVASTMPLESALYQLQQKRLPDIAEAGFEFVAVPQEVEFVIPPGFEAVDPEWEGRVKAAFPNTKLRITDNGPLRHGFALIRLLGDRLGVYSFRPRSRPDDTDLGWVIEHEWSACERVIGYCVDAWNKPILATQRGKAAKPQTSVSPFTLAKSLCQLFDFFLDQVETQFPSAAMVRKQPSIYDTLLG